MENVSFRQGVVDDYDIYLLIDEILVIISDTELPLHLLDLSPLKENLLLDVEHFLAGQLALPHKCKQLPCIFELFTQSSKFLGTLRVPATSFAGLANLSSTETYIWVRIVRFLAGFELQRVCQHAVYYFDPTTQFTHLQLRLQRSVSLLHPPGSPMVVNGSRPFFDAIFDKSIERLLDLCI